MAIAAVVTVAVATVGDLVAVAPAVAGVVLVGAPAVAVAQAVAGSFFVIDAVHAETE